MLITRTTLKGTRAEGQLLRDFWGRYVRAYWQGKEDEEPIGDARAVFTEAVCAALQERLGAEVLETPVIFSERLSNRALASNLGFQDGSQCVVINSRFKADPEILAHTLVEEFAHAWQRLESVDFESQQSLAYDQRPYEIEAKHIATEILGYVPDEYIPSLQRDEPDGILYDKTG